MALISAEDLNLTEYSDTLVYRIVEKATVLSSEEIKIRFKAIVPLDAEGVADYGRRVSNLWARAFDQPEVFFAAEATQNIEVEYAPGWDEGMFATDKKALILPDRLLAQLEVTVGQEVVLLEKDGRVRGNFVVAGQYTGHILSLIHI